jgi:hypothetical protein
MRESSMPDPRQDIDQQLVLLKEYLRTNKFKENSSEHRLALNFINNFPRPLTAEEARDVEALLDKAITERVAPGSSKADPFDNHVPKKGWFRKYYDYTLTSEPPAAFHFACAYTMLGAVMERHIFFDKTFYKVYPNVALVLIAPTGKCRKSSATNIALALGRAVNLNVLSERVTPEAMVEGLKERSESCGLVYAPELAVFLGRQKYLEGMVPLLTTLFDAPDVWKSTTLMRGEAVLTNVALSLLGASTLEWFVDALPREAFSGGFMSRLLFVVQEDTDRTFALPTRPEGFRWESLREDLEEIQRIRGEVTFTREAREWYEQWYAKHHHMPVFDEKFAGYHERKPDHLIRMAMLMSVAEVGLLEVQLRFFEQALDVLNWLESKLPGVFSMAASTPAGALHQKIISILRSAGGTLPHSVLLRKVQHMVNARTFYEAINTLVDSKTIRESRTALGHSYELIEGRRE